MNTNKIRVVCVEAEASDEAVQEILRTLAFGGPSVIVASLKAPAVEPVPVLPPPAPLPSPIAPLEAKRATHSRKKQALAFKFKRPETAPGGSTRTAIIQALTKRAMTSGEVIKETGLAAQAIYSTLNVMRKAGEVESRPEEGSIYPKQYLVKKWAIRI